MRREEVSWAALSQRQQQWSAVEPRNANGRGLGAWAALKEQYLKGGDDGGEDALRMSGAPLQLCDCSATAMDGSWNVSQVVICTPID